MATLIVEERPQNAELDLSVSLNGLPLSDRSTIRAGDRLRVGDAILRFDPGSFSALLPAPTGCARVAEPSFTYDHGSPAESDDRICDDARPCLVRSPELVAHAPCMRRLLDRVRRVACGDSPVVLLGESGTGKDLLARAIHANGPRADRPFVAVNAAALPESVIESELFGHERGAFTGASSRRKGLFEAASGGTLFLDEVGELPTASQAKLLRVLESGEVRRVGGAEAIRIDARVVAATNRDLRREVERGHFRADLYYRLAVVELEIPPLRDRRGDLEPLCRQLLAAKSRAGGRPSLRLSPAALEVLRGHSFPGNVRELRNVLEHAANFCDSEEIEPCDLPPQLRIRHIGPERFRTLAEAEREHVAAALAHAAWNKTRAAALLGIDRKTLYAKIEAHGLTPGSAPSSTLSEVAPEEHATAVDGSARRSTGSIS